MQELHRTPETEHDGTQFFTVASLYTIEEGSRGSKSTTSNPSSMVMELSSTHSEGITALPPWEPRLARINSSRNQSPRVQSPIMFPKRIHTRHNSHDPILAKGIQVKGNDCAYRSGASTPADKEYGGSPRRSSRMVIWLAIAAGIVIALAVILGAVLGTFVSGRTSSGPEPAVTAVPAGTPPTVSTGANITSLAVTGWSVPGDLGYYTVWLFSQDDDGYLTRHSFNSSTGNWTRVTNFVSARPQTPLAAATFSTQYYVDLPNYAFDNTVYQAEVVYLDETNDISEWIFPDSGPVIGQPGSLNKQMYIAHPMSKIAFYWPSIVYQGMSGEIREAKFECLKKDECWNDNVLATSEPSNGTRIVAIPMRNNLSSTGVFYGDETNQFINYQEDQDGNSSLWSNQAFTRQIPQTSSVAAFSVSLPERPDLLNTYLLWQDANNTIQMSWEENDIWRGPIAHPAFANANANTALACLTGLTFPGFPLRPGLELSRCYFQVGNTIREVSFDGTSWDIVGIVPTFDL